MNEAKEEELQFVHSCTSLASLAAWMDESNLGGARTRLALPFARMQGTPIKRKPADSSLFVHAENVFPCQQVSFDSESSKKQSKLQQIELRIMHSLVSWLSFPNERHNAREATEQR